MDDLEKYCREVLLKYMTRKTPNTDHTAIGLRFIVEKEIGRHISQGDLTRALAELGIAPTMHYPISEKYYQYIHAKRKRERREREEAAKNG